MPTAAAWDPTASRTDTMSDHLYGFRKPRRRTNVRRYDGVSAIAAI
jgi:hypothetical protein